MKKRIKRIGKKGNLSSAQADRLSGNGKRNAAEKIQRRPTRGPMGGR